MSVILKKYDPRGKRIRREGGFDLGCFSGVRPLEDKCRVSKPPGMHAKRAGRRSDYALQLRAKQRLRHAYGVSEKQFRHRYYEGAARQKGATGLNMLMALESRLDNLVYRAGFGSTRAEARQLVSHGSIVVDGQRVTIPSFAVKVGSTIQVAEKAKSQVRIRASLELAKQRTCDWVQLDEEQLLLRYTRHPEETELPDYHLNLIVELYSK